MTMLIRVIILVCLNNTVHMNIENLHIGHKYLEKLIMLRVGKPYWIHHKFKSQKGPRTCYIIIQGEILGITTNRKLFRPSLESLCLSKPTL